jgi:hypothetical protein
LRVEIKQSGTATKTRNESVVFSSIGSPTSRHAAAKTAQTFAFSHLRPDGDYNG